MEAATKLEVTPTPLDPLLLETRVIGSRPRPESAMIAIRFRWLRRGPSVRTGWRPRDLAKGGAREIQ
jgi:hypothetical protein